MFCRMPHNAMIIQPNGDLAVCCSNELSFNYGHISEVEDLQEVWSTHEKMNKLRKDDQEVINEACYHCLKGSRLSENRWIDVNKKSTLFRSISIDDKIRLLEFTTSNICNQTCVSCSSYYSSKWRSLEQEALEMSLRLDEWKKHTGFNSFGHNVYRLSDEDIKKIFKILPDLEVLYIKGGEPFADDNNYKVLEELVRVNRRCRIAITSNMSKVPEKYLKLLYGRSVTLSCSIDGVGKTYEYIRSSKFEDTIESIKKWRRSKILGPVTISMSLSIYNMFNIHDIVNFWENNLIEEVSSLNFQRWVRTPLFISPAYLLTQKQIDEYYDSLGDLTSNRIVIKNLYKLKSEDIDDEERQTYRRRFHMYTKFMNYKRGINIYDLHPQLLNV